MGIHELFIPFAYFEPATPPDSRPSTCHGKRKKEKRRRNEKLTVRLAAFPVRGTTFFVRAGIRATGFRYLTETGRPAFPCTRHSGADGRRVPSSEHLLTVAGAAHVGRNLRLRVSRLTAHQTNVRAPERRHCKRDL